MFLPKQENKKSKTSIYQKKYIPNYLLIILVLQTKHLKLTQLKPWLTERIYVYLCSVSFYLYSVSCYFYSAWSCSYSASSFLYTASCYLYSDPSYFCLVSSYLHSFTMNAIFSHLLYILIYIYIYIYIYNMYIYMYIYMYICIYIYTLFISGIINYCTYCT